MQNATERRMEILAYISKRRQLTYKDIAYEFKISYRTARRDVEILSCSYPIKTVQGNGGGIRVADGWSLYRRYLHNDQEALLRELMTGLQPDKQKTMQEILDAFAKPKVKEKND